MKLSALEKQTFVIIALFTAFNLVIILAIILPTIRSIRTSETRTAELRDYQEKRYKRILNLRSSFKKIGAIREATIHYPNFLFKRGEELDLITTLEKMAARNKVTQNVLHSNLDSYSLSDEKINLKIGIGGSYRAALNYLIELESLPYFLNADKLVLVPTTDRQGQNGGTANLVSMELDLSLYVNQEKPSAN